jgi:CSLREA domain-containing protein
MVYREQWIGRTFRDAIFRGLLLIALTFAVAFSPFHNASAQTPPTADYRFQNTRISSVGTAPALIDFGTNTFATATVDGNTSRRVLHFAQGNGLRLIPTTGVIGNSSYTVVMLFELDTLVGYRRIIDFKNGTSDRGLYFQGGLLRFFPAAQGSTEVVENSYVQVALTRDASSKAVVGYVDGVQQFAFTDAANDAVINANNILRFFRDNQSGGTTTEHSAGSVARVRLYNKVLPPSEIAALDRTDFIVNSGADNPDNNTGDGKCFTGTTTFGVEDCTLRAAIQQANANPGPNTINFGIPTQFGNTPNAYCNQTTKVCTIRPSTEFPGILGGVRIDGYTQGESTPATAADDARENTLVHGTNASLKIELSGELAGSGTAGLVMYSNSLLRGFIINRWKGFALRIGWFIPSDGTRIEGNFFGTDSTGKKALGNSQGIVVWGGANNVIGGRALAARNLISGNGDGIRFVGDRGQDCCDTIRGTRIEGNLIGTNASGGRLGNLGFGVLLCCADVFGTTISNNVIAFNGTFGVALFIPAGRDPVSISGNRILTNSIFQNGGLGIDLKNDGVTANDARDPDTGPNTLQNFPVLTSAVTSSTGTTIKGSINSTPNKDFLIQFFRTAAVDGTGYGEGDTFIGQLSVHTNALGGASFTFHPATAVPAGRAITSTATGPGGNTSEFSKGRLVVNGS